MALPWRHLGGHAGSALRSVRRAPRRPPAAPHAGLSALLSKLRRTLGPSTLTGIEALRLRLPDDALIDFESAVGAVHRAESLIANGDLDPTYGQALRALYVAERGLLAGFEAPWIDDRRRELDDVLARALECLAEWGPRFGGSGVPTGEHASRRLIELAPYRESGHRFLMEALAARDNRAEALQVYERCRTMLREELGTVPCQTLQELHRKLLLTPA